MVLDIAHMIGQLSIVHLCCFRPVSTGECPSCPENDASTSALGMGLEQRQQRGKGICMKILRRVAAIVILFGLTHTPCSGVDWTGMPNGWMRVDFPPSDDWTIVYRSMDAMDLSANIHGETVLYVAHWVKRFPKTKIGLFSLNLDDEHRRWKAVDLPDGPRVDGSSGHDELLYVIASNDFYYIDGNNELWHGTGTNWTYQLDLEDNGYLYGFAPNEIVAVGSAGSYVYNGTTWEDVSATLYGPDGDYALWRNGYRDYFEVTSWGIFRRWQDGTVTILNTPEIKQITGVWGFSPTDVYITQIFGDADTRIRHYDGVSVTTVWEEPLPTNGTFWHLTGLDDGTLMAVGHDIPTDVGFIATRSPTGTWSYGSFTNAILAVDSLGMHSAVIGRDAMVGNLGDLPANAGPRFRQAVAGNHSIDFPFTTALREETTSFQLEVSFDGGEEWLPSSWWNIYEVEGVQVASGALFTTRTSVLYRVTETRSP